MSNDLPIKIEELMQEAFLEIANNKEEAIVKIRRVHNKLDGFSGVVKLEKYWIKAKKIYQNDYDSCKIEFEEIWGEDLSELVKRRFI